MSIPCKRTRGAVAEEGAGTVAAELPVVAGIQTWPLLIPGHLPPPLYLTPQEAASSMEAVTQSVLPGAQTVFECKIGRLQEGVSPFLLCFLSSECCNFLHIFMS